MNRSAHSSNYESALPKPIYQYPLHGKAIIITGAGSGIGRATALLLATQGARLALTDLDAEAGKGVCGEVRDLGLKTDVVFAALDVRDDDAVGKLVRTFRKTYKRLDGLVNCAGINPNTPLLADISLTTYKEIMDTNVQGPWNFSSHFLKAVVEAQKEKDKKDGEGSWMGMKLALEDENKGERGGYSIVNVGSVASLKGLPSSAAYSASKHALVGFTKSLAREYASYGVRINLVAPGPIDTPLLHTLFNNDIHPTVQTVQEHVNEVVPMKRLGQPGEVAKAIVWLLGEESSFVTGVVLPVDGGWMA